jgi:hypothetical protein
MKPKPSTPTPASPSEAPPRPPLVNPPLLGTPKPVVLCPGCRAELKTNVSHRVGAVIVRYHQCGQCGLTRLRTHQTTDGMLAFAGYAREKAVQTRPVAVEAQPVPPISTR